MNDRTKPEALEDAIAARDAVAKARDELAQACRRLQSANDDVRAATKARDEARAEVEELSGRIAAEAEWMLRMLSKVLA